VAAGLIADVKRLALLLRGINVGGNNKIAMSDLKSLLGALGYSDITTLLNSGNAVVTTSDEPDQAERQVSKAISEQLGLKIETMARTHDELAAVVAANPLATVATNPSHYAVAFLRSAPPAGALNGVDPAIYAPECWKLIGRELFIWYANGQARTKLGAAFFEKQLEVAATARNWNTVEKLLALTA
jgi:uncharacterized protein (DUF1697 family)